MSATPYATSAELAAWTHAAAPANADQLLARASEVVDFAVTVPFGVDEEGLPRDGEVAEALRDAACAQVAFWTEVGYEHDVDGLAGTSYAVGGLSGERPPIVAPQARRILKLARLL